MQCYFITTNNLEIWKTEKFHKLDDFFNQKQIKLAYAIHPILATKIDIVDLS